MSDKEKVKQEVTIIWGMDKETKEKLIIEF